jgi:hypothetical protein
VQPLVKLNVLRAQNFQYKAGAMVSFNASINVPAATAAGPGTQTVTGRCTAPVGSKFFAIGTHTRAHATVADVNLVSNGLTTNIVHTTDWSYCDVGVWTAPQFLTTQSGDSFGYSCAYANQGTTAVTVGETELASEACMTVGYYFPAGGSLCM